MDKDALMVKLKELEEENQLLKKTLANVEKHPSLNGSISHKIEEEKYKLFVEEQTDLVVKMDIEGHFLFANDSFLRLFNYDEKKIIGSNYDIFVEKHELEKIKQGFKSLHKAPHTFYYEKKSKTSQGEKWLGWTCKAVFKNDDTIRDIICVGRDITYRKNAQLSLHKYVREMDTINRFLRKLTSSLSIDEVIKASVDAIARSFKNTLVAFYMIEEEKVMVKNSNIKEIKLNKKVLENPQMLSKIKQVIEKQKPYNYHKKSKNIYDFQEIHNFTIFPCSGSHLLKSALMFCGFSSEEDFNEQQTFFETLCNEVSVAMQNAYLFEEIKIHSSELFRANKDLLQEIGEREKAEKALKSSEEKYRSLFENAADGIIIFDKEGNILDVNDSFCKLVAIPKNEILCKAFSSVFIDNQLNEIDKILEGKVLLLEKMLKSKNQHTAVEVNIRPLGDRRFQAFFRDITERTIAEQKLIETNNLFQAINNASPDGIFILNIKSKRFVFNNKRLLDMFQYTQEEMDSYGNMIELLVHEDDRIIPKYHFDRLLKAADGVKIESELRFRRKDKKIVWVLIREQVFSRDAKGNVIESVGSINDISERKKAEEDILHTNNFLQAIFHTSPDVIFVSDYQTSNIFYISRKIEDLSLYSLQYCINSKNILEELVHPDDKPSFKSLFEELRQVKENNSLELEFRLIRQDNSIIWVRAAIIVFKKSEQGEILQTLGIIREVTERKMAHQKLLNSETKFRNIFNTSADGIAILNHHKKIIEANDSLLKMTGMTRDELSTTKFGSLVEKSAGNKLILALEACQNKKNVNIIETALYNKNGKKNAVEIDFKLIDYEGTQAVLGIIHNISERKEAEKKVFDAIIVTEEKERETFAKNLHDDLGPLLSSIRMYLNSFQDTSDAAKQDYIIHQVNSILKQAIQCTKEVSNDLSPHILTNYGIVSAIESFISNFTDLVKINFNTNISTQRFQTIVEMTIFRISKELINNTLKHAEASKIDITLNYSEEKIKMTYTDNGKGFDFEGEIEGGSSGMGVFNIKNRVKTLNGDMEFSSPAKGVKYLIHIPAKVKTKN